MQESHKLNQVRARLEQQVPTI